jgi:hypothetical protein
MGFGVQWNFFVFYLLFMGCNRFIFFIVYGVYVKNGTHTVQPTRVLPICTWAEPAQPSSGLLLTTERNGGNFDTFL